MRLVCPNCSAQYEVDASMIPEEGRDVQCSNCGTTWFELGDHAAAAEAISAEPEPEPQPEPEAEAAPEPTEEEVASARERSRPRELSREVFEADDDEDDKSWETPSPSETTDEADDPDENLSDAVQAIAAASSDDGTEDEGDEGAKTVAARARRPADAAALDILKEEAERELSRRRAPASESLETQTDMGLDEVRGRQTASRALRARMAYLGEEQEDEAPAAVEKQVTEEEEQYEPPRRDLLPDIDEINSTLKPASRRKEVPPEVAARKKSGFRAGFLLMILAVVGAVFVYAQAPAIARALPQTEAPLIKFVDGANALRDKIDGLIAN